ncbi:hypothetical protein RRG08_051642 [Elysia crispata]|uniref:Uncharacterized protein n=1 Tax=Elysia crispata TaxID=231223 RepID=A0AAE1DRG6_9GAST|nr:hypothetical protein RRG08_051642 [Elysia crispata]
MFLSAEWMLASCVSCDQFGSGVGQCRLCRTGASEVRYVYHDTPITKVDLSSGAHGQQAKSQLEKLQVWARSPTCRDSMRYRDVKFCFLWKNLISYWHISNKVSPVFPCTCLECRSNSVNENTGVPPPPRPGTSPLVREKMVIGDYLPLTKVFFDLTPLRERTVKAGAVYIKTYFSPCEPVDYGQSCIFSNREKNLQNVSSSHCHGHLSKSARGFKCSGYRVPFGAGSWL